MLSRPETPNTQRDDPPRQRCRNPRCRGKLKLPTYRPLDAFCCRGCFDQFYRSRCRVCERPITRKTERRQLCGSRKCQSEFRAHRERFSSTRYSNPTFVTNGADLHFQVAEEDVNYVGIEHITWRRRRRPAAPSAVRRSPSRTGVRAGARISQPGGSSAWSRSSRRRNSLPRCLA